MDSAFCTGCGKPTSECSGCRLDDPPHFCPECATWMAVVVTPTGWAARCRAHGTVAEGTGVDASGRLDTH